MSSEAIVVSAGALDVARRVGPTAWTVLIALAMDAEATARRSGRARVRAVTRSNARA